MASLAIAAFPRPQVAAQPLPEPTRFTNAAGDFAHYYFKNNPWKLSQGNSWQKIYRFCIICGNERFSSQEWAKVLSLWGPPAVCKNRSCRDALPFVAGLVPRHHSLIETDLDRSRIGRAQFEEFFEDIQETIHLERWDKVYRSEEEMPVEYVEILKRLETFPVETRLGEIDSICFKYRQENNLVGASDPFLQTLAIYRQQSLQILHTLGYGNAR